MKNANRFSQGLKNMAKIAAASGAMYMGSMAKPQEVYAQTPAPQDKKCTCSEVRIPIGKNLEERVRVDTVTNTIVRIDTVYVPKIVTLRDTIRIVEEGGEVDLPPTAMPPPISIEAPEEKYARFHFNPFGGRNGYTIMGAEAGLVWRFFGASVNYARAFDEKGHDMQITMPRERMAVGEDVRSDWSSLGAAVELHLPLLFVGAGYNTWKQNRTIDERIQNSAGEDLAVNIHSEVEDGKAYRFFGGLNLPLTRNVSLKLIGGVYTFPDTKDKPIYFGGVGANLAIK